MAKNLVDSVLSFSFVKPMAKSSRQVTFVNHLAYASCPWRQKQNASVYHWVSKSQELLPCLLPPASRSGEHFVVFSKAANAFTVNLCISVVSSQGLSCPRL